MSLYAFHCRDGAEAGRLRTEHLQLHLHHVEANIERYAVAGPLKSGDKTVGSLVIVEAEDEAEARRFFEHDPYFIAGVWADIHVAEFRGVAGDWVGGAVWKA